MSTEFYQKNKERLQKNAHKRYQNLLEETKSENIFLNNIKFFPKKKKIKGVSMNMSAIKVSLKFKSKG